MRMFTDYTAGSLSDRPRGQRAWSENIPRLSLASPFVADGMLALAALHLAKLQSNGNAGAADSYLSMATNKLNKSLPIFRSALERMNDKNCDALFIFAAMIVVFLFATALEDCKTHLDSLTSLSDLPPNNNVRRRREFEIGSAMLARHVQTFQALRGSLFIITSYFPRLKMGPCSDICSRDFWPTDPIPEAMEKARADVLIDDHHLKSLQKLWQDERPEARSTLDKTLEDLRWSYALLSCISSGPSAATTSSLVIHTQNFLPNKSPTTSPIMDRSAVLAFPTTMLAEFSRLVDQHNKAALVLWTYYAVLLDRIGDIWWSKGIGKQNALAIALILGPESRKCLEWPMKSLGLDDIWL
ncbi:MAG: hypothetical protein M1822_000371 [Bathelium mastoideum]|nr:MAG: hypothetical protein M1822_000371 [Bathelium mastoideum]